MNSPRQSQPSWRRNSALAGVIVVVFLLVQLTIPTLRLFDEGRNHRLGWQMYADYVPSKVFTVATGDGELQYEPTDVMVLARVDIDYDSVVPPHLCATVPGATEVRWNKGSLQC